MTQPSVAAREAAQTFDERVYELLRDLHDDPASGLTGVRAGRLTVRETEVFDAIRQARDAFADAFAAARAAEERERNERLQEALEKLAELGHEAEDRIKTHRESGLLSSWTVYEIADTALNALRAPDGEGA